MIIVKVRTPTTDGGRARVAVVGSRIEIHLEGEWPAREVPPDVALALALALAVTAGSFATAPVAAVLSAAKLCTAQSPAEQESLEQLCDAISDAFEAKRRGLCFCGCSECSCCVGSSGGGDATPFERT